MRGGQATFVGFAMMAVACGKAAPGPTATQLLGAQPRVALLADGGVPALDAGFSEFSLFLDTQSGDLNAITVKCDQGDCPVQQRIAHAGAQVGTLAVIVDDSGSNTASAMMCTGCPTDPNGQRVDGVKALFSDVIGAAPAWRGALFDFGPNPNGQFKAVRLLAGYTSYVDDLVAGAGQLKALGGTPLYESIVDVAPTVDGDALFADAGMQPLHILVASDGEDTTSTHTVAQAVAAAKQYGITIDVVGYGQGTDGHIPLLAGKAYRDLRLFATETQGFAALVPTDELKARFDVIAACYLSGYVELQVAMPPGATQVTGTVHTAQGDVMFIIE
jgi:hypothetical protein